MFFSGSSSKKHEKLHFKDVEKNLAAEEELNCIERLAKKLLTLMVNRFQYLHKMDNLFVDVKRKSVFYKTDQKREPILKKKNGTVKNYSLNDESYESLVAILKKQEENGEDFAEKVDTIEKEMKNLVKKMENVERILDGIVDKLKGGSILQVEG